MRLTEEQLRIGIGHPILRVRTRAIQFFAMECCTDQTLMPLVIQAIETYGRQQAVEMLSAAMTCPQSAETLSWLIRELQNPENRQFKQYPDYLSQLVLNADPMLLAPKQSEILKAPLLVIEEFELQDLNRRLEMATWDESVVWEQLDNYLREHHPKAANDFEYDDAKLFIETLTRFGATSETRILLELAGDEKEYRNKYVLFVELAGRIRLLSALPILLEKIKHNDDEYLWAMVGSALVQMGTPEVIDAVRDLYLQTPPYNRPFLIAILRDVHSDRTVEVIQELLLIEKDAGLVLELASALLANFALDGIDIARKVISKSKGQSTSRSLRDQVLDMATLLGTKFSEQTAWQEQRAAEERDAKRFEESLKQKLQPAVPAPPTPLAAPPSVPEPRGPQLPVNVPSADRPKAGRNDPCPCGSGRKFKNCCLNS